jgi:hypothetical protein
MLNRFLTAMGEQRKDYHWILNLDQWLATIMTLTGRFLNLRDKRNAMDPIYGKIIFSRTRSSTPFIGMDSYFRTIEQSGIPVVQDSLVMFPAGSDVNAFRILKDDPTRDAYMRPFELIAPLILNGITALGVILDLANPEDFGRELGTALDRGANGSTKRNDHT